MKMKDLNKKQKQLLAVEIIENIEDLKFARDLEDFKNGHSKREFPIPSRDEILGLFRKSTKLSDSLKIKIKEIAAGFHNSLVAMPAGARGETQTENKIKFGDQFVEVSIYCQSENGEIEIFSNDDQIIGKTIRIKAGEQINQEIPFESIEVENFKAVAYFEIPKEITEAQIDALEWEIEV